MPVPQTTEQSSTRVAIVTGAAQGIGEAIVLKLADDGIDVAMFDLPQKHEQLESVARAIKEKGRQSLVLVGDVTVEADVVAMVDKTVEVLGGLDIMIANAGVFWLKPFLESTVEEWEKMMSVNTRGVMLCYKHAARQMIEQGRGGRIVGGASLAAKRGFPQASAYCASKFAVRGLTQSVASELQGYNITVNAYAPGFVDTPMTAHPDDQGNGGPCTTLMKTVGLPKGTRSIPTSVIADIVSYLVKPEASFITGQCLNINGGAVMD